MMPAKYDLTTLYRIVRQALDCSDDIWYRYVVQSDICGCNLSHNEEQSVLDGAVLTAASMAQCIIAKHGCLSPQELLAVLNIKLEHTVEDLCEPYLYLGLYEPAVRTVILNDSAISLVKEFIRENNLDVFTPIDDIMRIALFHEIFHALEEDTPDIYTRSRMLKRKILGIFPYRRGLSSVSEVGALHFSKCLTGISYSPCIYERYLLMALNRVSIDFLSPKV